MPLAFLAARAHCWLMVMGGDGKAPATPPGQRRVTKGGEPPWQDAEEADY